MAREVMQVVVSRDSKSPQEKVKMLLAFGDYYYYTLDYQYIVMNDQFGFKLFVVLGCVPVLESRIAISGQVLRALPTDG